MSGPTRPLDLKEKWLFVQWWAKADPPLKYATFRVLVVLVQRQNVKTGQCNPSARGLASDANMCLRSARNAISELEARGAIRVERKPNVRNRYVFLRPWEHSPDRKPGTHCVPGMQSNSPGGAAGLPDVVTPDAPEKKKERIKEKSGNHERSVPFNGWIPRTKATTRELTQKQLEDRAKKCFEREGLTYNDLVDLPVGLFQDTYQDLIAERLTFRQAIQKLLDAASGRSG